MSAGLKFLEFKYVARGKIIILLSKMLFKSCLLGILTIAEVCVCVCACVFAYSINAPYLSKKTPNDNK